MVRPDMKHQIEDNKQPLDYDQCNVIPPWSINSLVLRCYMQPKAIVSMQT